MCCCDGPLPKRKPASMKSGDMADRAIDAMYKVKLKTRAAKGASIARAKRVGIKRSGGNAVPFGGG